VYHHSSSAAGCLFISGALPDGTNATWQWDIVNQAWTVLPAWPAAASIPVLYSFTVGGVLVIISEDNPNSAWYIDTASVANGWAQLTMAQAPRGRVSSRYLDWGSVLYAWGGADVAGTTITGLHNDMWAIEITSTLNAPMSGHGWVQVTADGAPGTPPARVGSSFVSFQAHALLFGGVIPPLGSDFRYCAQPGASNCVWLNDVWTFGPGNRGAPAPAGITGSSWTRFNAVGAYGGPAISPRVEAAAGTTGDQLFVFGGIGPGGAVLNDLWAFNLVSSTWQQVTKTSPWPSGDSTGAGLMLARRLFIYVPNGATGNSLWEWSPVASAGSAAAAVVTPPPHPGTVAGLTIACLLGVANLAGLFFMWRRSSPSYIATPIPGDVYTAAL
jgi:hypothetical protein